MTQYAKTRHGFRLPRSRFAVSHNQELELEQGPDQELEQEQEL